MRVRVGRVRGERVRDGNGCVVRGGSGRMIGVEVVHTCVVLPLCRTTTAMR